MLIGDTVLIKHDNEIRLAFILRKEKDYLVLLLDGKEIVREYWKIKKATAADEEKYGKSI